MRAAILYKDKEILVEFPPKVFAEMLKTYMKVSKRSKTAKKIDIALDKIVKELKNKTRLK